MRRLLVRWYEHAKRDLPWRATRDPYRIWISEVMLQQTRVAAALPYYERFLARFPDVGALAAADEADVLAAWSGLGYYSRARNLRRAAIVIAGAGGFPRDYASLRALPGVGDYTAAAVASIAFGLPHAAVDGNVQRVLARVFHGGPPPREAAVRLLDTRDPGRFNQALMELGATVCLPEAPRCPSCPLERHCTARRAGVEKVIGVKSRNGRFRRIPMTLLVIQHGNRILVWQRGPESKRMAGFWELPEPAQVPGAVRLATAGRFRHTITTHHYEVTVEAARLRKAPPGFRWLSEAAFERLPVSTLARKALVCALRHRLPGL